MGSRLFTLSSQNSKRGAKPSRFEMLPKTFAFRESVAVKSIAVLPFANLSGDQRTEYFSHGLTDAIMTRLTRLPGLKVAPWTASLAFRNADAETR
jgi:TolB-like protein